MTTKGKLISIFYPFLIRLAYLLNLRIPWSLLCRKLQDETQRKPLTKYKTPEELEAAMKNFQYRKDPLNGSIDYVSHPEYVQWALDNPDVKDEDCDGGHWYVANALKMIPGVENVLFLNSGWDGPKGSGGHSTAVYQYFGKWYHFDWKIYSLEDPCSAVSDVAKRYGGPNAEVTFWVWESVGEVGKDRSGWKPLAIVPDKLEL